MAILFAIKINGNDIFLILGAVGGLLAVLLYVVLYNRMMVYEENHAYQAVSDKETETKKHLTSQQL